MKSVCGRFGGVEPSQPERAWTPQSNGRAMQTGRLRLGRRI